MSNILICSAGKRVELLLEFQKELKKFQPGAQVFCVDLNPAMSPACRLADKCFRVPRVTESDYTSELLDVCKKNNARIVIPTIDTELAVLSKVRQEFKREGITIVVSDSDFISICRDKRKTMLLFEELKIRNPRLIDKFNPSFPLFAKPYDGSLSSNIHLIRKQEDLTEEILNDKKLIFMEYIDKTEYKEYTVDMYFGNDHKVKSIVPRERLEIRAGEINKGITRKNYIVDFLKSRMEYMPGVRGCICLQLFYRDSDNDIIGIEINPRFGGGYPLSFYAGANFPAMIIKEYMFHERLVYRDDWKDNTIMLRFDSQVIV